MEGIFTHICAVTWNQMLGKYMPNMGKVGLQNKSEDIFYVMITKKRSSMSSIFFGYIQPKRRGKTFAERLSKVIHKKGRISTKISLRKTETWQIPRLRCKWRCKCWMWVLVLGQNAPVSSISAIQKVRWCQCGGMDLFHDPVNHIVLLIREKYACTKVFSENIIPFCMGVSHWCVVHMNLLFNCRPYMPNN